MRIIAGTHRGRLLRGPKGQATRPITDRVKVNLFNILAGQLDGAVVADCFCGTGSLGLEALSRGAVHATFVEIDPAALRLLRENIDTLGFSGRCRIVRQDVLRRGIPSPAECGPLGAESKAPAAPTVSNTGQRTPDLPGPYSLVFLDPPYQITETGADRLWAKLDESSRAGSLAPEAVIVWRYATGVRLAEPPAERFSLFDQRTYGSQMLAFFLNKSSSASEV